MRARDLVCGMTVDTEASVAERYEGLLFHFCARGCADAFRADPHRFLEPGAHDPGPEDAPLTSRPCPACGEATRAATGVAEAALPLPIPELATLVRNEWRRRLGPGRYAEPHPLCTARWALLAAVGADQDAPAAVARALLADGVHRGLRSPPEAGAELHHLMDAVQAVLAAMGLRAGGTEVARARALECLGAWASGTSRGATPTRREGRLYLRSRAENLR